MMRRIFDLSSGVRDPVHRWIPITAEEKKLLNNPYVQRLRRLKQLGFAEYVYPSATHTRFEHSLGAMHLVTSYGMRLFQGAVDEEKTIRTLRVAGLLHDIAHGPFSHTWDRVVYSRIYPGKEKGHDVHRFLLLEQSSLSEAIQRCDVSPKDVCRMWVTPPFCQMLQGDLGADRMDYMLRDSYHTGMQHVGSLSPERIIANAYIKDGKLFFSPKVQGEINRALEGRTYMYDLLYRHKTVQRITDYFEDLLIRAIEEEGAPFVENTKNVERFVFLDEYEVFTFLRQNDRLRASMEKVLFRSVSEKSDDVEPLRKKREHVQCSDSKCRVHDGVFIDKDGTMKFVT